MTASAPPPPRGPATPGIAPPTTPSVADAPEGPRHHLPPPEPTVSPSIAGGPLSVAQPHPTSAHPPDADRRQRRHRLVVVLLAIAGVALLVASAATFTAMTWSRLSPAVQSAVVVGVAVVAIGTSVLMQRRRLPIVAASVGVFAALAAVLAVVALDRAATIAVDQYLVTVAAVAAMSVAVLLGRAQVAGSSWTGSLATVIGVVSWSVALTLPAGRPAHQFVIIAVVVAWVGIAAGRLWREGGPRAVTTMAMTGWMTLVSLVGAGATLTGVVSPTEGLTAAAASLGALLMVQVVPLRRWWTHHHVVVGSLAFVGSAYAAAITAAVVRGGGLPTGPDVTAPVIAVLAVVMLIGAQGLSRWQGARWWALAAGLAPAAMVVVGAVLGAVLRGLFEILAVPAGLATPRTSRWMLLAAVLVAASAAHWSRVRRWWPWLAAPVVAIALATVAQSQAWLITSAVTVALAVVVWRTQRSPVALGIVILAVGSAGLPLASKSSTAVATAGLLAGLAALAVGHRSLRGPCLQRTLALTAFTVAGIAGGISAAALMVRLELGDAWQVPVAAGLVVSHGVAWFASQHVARRTHPTGVVAAVVASVGTFVVLWSAPLGEPIGWLLFLSGAGWLVLAEVGLRLGRWVGPGLMAVGALTILIDAAVDPVELLTLPLAAVVGWLTLRRVLADGQRSSHQLWPAMVVGFVPSLALLVVDPMVTWRALTVVVIAGLVVALGVRRSLVAPVIGGTVTVMVAAITQLGIVWQAVPRWITFGIVGLVLVWLAATSERQRERALSARRRLTELR